MAKGSNTELNLSPSNPQKCIYIQRGVGLFPLFWGVDDDQNIGMNFFVTIWSPILGYKSNNNPGRVSPMLK